MQRSLPIDAQRRVNGALSQFDGLYRRMARDRIGYGEPWHLYKGIAGYILMRADAEWNGDVPPIAIANVQSIGRNTLKDRLIDMEQRQIARA